MSFVGTLSRLGSIISKFKPKQLSTRLRETRQKMFTKYLLITNITISASFSGLGDFIEQSYEKLAGYLDKYDRFRTFKLATTGIPVGFVCHYWYIFLDKRLPLRTGKTLIKKVRRPIHRQSEV
jgi:protein Mpv17